MRCPRCQHENRDEARFCAACGSSLAAQCPACGLQPPPGAAFCDHCGRPLTRPFPPIPPPVAPRPQTLHAYTPKHLAEKILTARSALEGERRQVTVLFADLAGFTSLAEERDPEEVHTLINRCFECITTEVHRFEGTINQYTGDGIMALFGAPIAHEDSPRRAVHAALGHYQQQAQYHRRNVEALQGQWRLERFGEPGLPSVFCRAYLDWGLAELGAFVEGLARGEEAIQIAETVDQPFTLSHAYLGVGLVHLRQGDLQPAITVLEKSLRVCQTGDIPLLLPWVASSLGYAYALSGRLAEALPLLERAVEQSAAMKLMIHHPLWMVYLGEAYLLAGRLEDAHQLAGHALTFSCDLKQQGYAAYALRLLGETAAHGDPPEAAQAEIHYRQAISLANELEMCPLLAHCHRGLGTLYAKSGQPDPARTELSAAIEWYRAMEMTFWLPEAEAALARVEGR